jgi:UPF0755 protein
VGLGLLLLLLLAGGLWLRSWLLFEPARPGEERVATLRVRPGTGLAAIADSLVALDLLDDPRRLLWAARLTGLDRGLQPGDFVLSSRLGPREMLAALQVYSVPSRRLRLIEGERLEDLAGLAARELGLDSLLLVELGRDSLFAASLGLPLPTLDGALFPDTYLVSALDGERELLVRLVERFREVLAELAPPGVLDTLDLRRLLVLASIVEAEVQLSSEADTVAAVYLNRLRRGMRLQADPTVQFLLPDGPRRLRFSDLEIDSPYNTYRYSGLPPGPIGNPGKAAMAGVLAPADCDYLFFVARGDGSHAFAHTYAEHLENRKPLDELRRRLAAERRAAQRHAAAALAEALDEADTLGEDFGDPDSLAAILDQP